MMKKVHTTLYIEDGVAACSVIHNKNLPVRPSRVATLARMESVYREI